MPYNILHMSSPLQEVFRLFLRLGFTAFGGPAAHIAMMKTEVVDKRQWMSEQHFLDLLGATNLIPGPNSTEMAIHLGYERAGWRGLILAGLCFILPAVGFSLALAWFYAQYGQLPQIKPLFEGIAPAVLAIILLAIYPLAQKTLQKPFSIALALAVVAGAVLGLNELYLLFGAGALGLAWAKFLFPKPSKLNQQSLGLLLFFQTIPSHTALFWTFLKIGSILYGSGYVLFAFLEAELVQKGWMSKQALVDAIAIGQFTPGPVFSAVTFIGYQISGWQGAFWATLGIFLPSFLLVALLTRLMAWLRSRPILSHFLDAVNVASIALILVVCWELAQGHWQRPSSLLIFGLSLGLLWRFPKLNSAWIVLLGAGLGYVLS